MVPSSLTRRLVLASLLALGACGQVPHPFQPRTKNPPPTRIGPRAALAVNLSALPPSWRRPILTALRQREIAAFESPSPPRNRYYATARPEGGKLHWRLRDPAGRNIGTAVLTTGEITDEPPPPLTARRAAMSLDNLLPGTPRAAIALYIPPVDGAPGDGRLSLTAALRQRLQRGGYRLARKVDTADYILLGAVRLSPPEKNLQRIVLTWSVIAPDGREMGRIEQKNTVPAGRLNGPWGAIADAAAEGAALGIRNLLHRLQQAK